MQDQIFPYLKVKNWEQFQHYKKRNPPWIKLHRAVFDDYDFESLPNGTQLDLIRLWILAASDSGYVPNDHRLLRRLSRADHNINIKLLVDKGFLIPYASKMLAPCKQNLIPESESEGDIHTHRDNHPRVPTKVKPFQKPTLLQVSDYMDSIGTPNLEFESKGFLDYYDSNGWRVGRNSMKDWKAAARNWKSHIGLFGGNGNGNKPNRAQQRSIDNQRAAEEALRIGAERDRRQTGGPSRNYRGDFDPETH